MPDPTIPPDDSLVVRTPKEKPMHTNFTNGPAANSVDARKNKKKCNNKNAPQPDEQRDAVPTSPNTQTSPMEVTPASAETPHLPTLLGTQAAMPTYYPQSDQGNTPPPMTLPPLHNENSLPPPPSPTTQIPAQKTHSQSEPLQVIDHDVSMDPPSEHQEPPATPAEKSPTPCLDTPSTTPNKLTLFDHLEEAENDRDSHDKHPAHTTLDKHSPGPMPNIQDTSPTSIFDHINLAMIKEWDARPGRKLLAVPFGPNVKILESHDFFHMKILTAVMEIITMQEASVAAPRQSKKAAAKNKTPTAFLIYNITVKQAKFMLQRKVWSSKATTFRVAPFATTCPTFLFAIKDLYMVGLKDIFPIICEVWDNEKTLQLIEELVNEVQAEDRAKVADEFNHLLASPTLMHLDIREAGNNLCPRFNVYADSTNFSNDKLWTCLQAFLIGRKYISPMEAFPATIERTPFICNYCHSVDHLRGLCPFPALPGWNGPKSDHNMVGDTFHRRNGGQQSGSPYFDQCPQGQRFSPHN
ncbi:hypothetical protein EI94DRAFT_1816666 [Lactarius quietus]|nr:hypothetical protein EI94DRAFT_1816666 [Lactarius quietus]